MSDRLAVFNDGRIEQVASPAEIYERPATSSWRGSWASPTSVERDGGTALHGATREDHGWPRPEAAPEGLHVEDGHGPRSGLPRARTPATTSPSTAAASSWSQQNLETSSKEALAQRGRRCASSGTTSTNASRLAECNWRRTDEEHCSGCSPRLWSAALAALRRQAATSDDDERGGGQLDSGGGGEAMQKVGKGEGEVNLIAWAGYVEDGSTDPAVDWVTPTSRRRPGARST